MGDIDGLADRFEGDFEGNLVGFLEGSNGVDGSGRHTASVRQEPPCLQLLFPVQGVPALPELASHI